MPNVLFTNVRIIDGSGAQPYSGEVLVQGNRIARVAKGVRSIPTAGITVIDAAGATLMPGMTEAHVHLAWNNAATLDAIYQLIIHKFIYPLELLFTATLLALVPYFVLRGPVNRIARRFIVRGTETADKDAER